MSLNKNRSENLFLVLFKTLFLILGFNIFLTTVLIVINLDIHAELNQTLHLFRTPSIKILKRVFQWLKMVNDTLEKVSPISKSIQSPSFTREG